MKGQSTFVIYIYTTHYTLHPPPSTLFTTIMFSTLHSTALYSGTAWKKWLLYWTPQDSSSDFFFEKLSGVQITSLHVCNANTLQQQPNDESVNFASINVTQSRVMCDSNVNLYINDLFTILFCFWKACLLIAYVCISRPRPKKGLIETEV